MQVLSGSWFDFEVRKAAMRYVVANRPKGPDEL